MVYPNASFEPASDLDAVEKHKCTGLHGVPTMFTAVLQEKEQRPRITKTLRTGIVAGSSCSALLINKINNDLNMTGLC